MSINTEHLTPIEQELIKNLHKGESKYYNAGLNHEIFVGLPNLSLETTEEAEDRMIDDYQLKYCFEKNINTNGPDFKKFLEAMHLVIKLFARSYRDGLKIAEEEAKCVV